MDKLSRFLALSGPEQRVLLQCFALHPAFWVGLRLAGLERMRRWSARPVPSVRGHGSALDARQLGRLVQSAGNRSLVPSTCLSRSLLLDWLLRRHGIRSHLRIGVRVAAGAIAPHAWVECDGMPVNGEPQAGVPQAVFDFPVSR